MLIMLPFHSSQINELGKKITEIKKSGKEVHAFLNNANKHNFLLASYAQNIYMPESKGIICKSLSLLQ